MSDLPNPINRYEKYLNAIATGNSDDLPTPTTREEVFLDYIAKNGGGSGSGEVTGVKGNAEGSYRRGNVNLTPTHLGLGNVDNTSDLNKPVSTAQQTALDGKVDKVVGKGLSTNDYDNTAKGIVDGVTSALAGKVSTSSVGSANGVAELDANGRVPSAQLPSYVDDVLEYADLAHFPATGETGKIYIAEDTNKTYRWSGSGYAEISESLALGETSSTAYAGNKGKANADAIAGIKNGTSINSFSAVETALQSYATKADVNIFHGTLNDWNNLSLADKIKYTDAMIEGGSSDNPVGNLSALTTNDKSSCVGAINEVNDSSFDIVTIDPTYAVSDQNWEIERLGKLRILRIKHLQSIPSGSTDIGSISSQDIPHNVVQIKVWGSTTDSHYNVSVNTSGIISIYNYAQTTTASEVLTAELVYVV